MDEIKYIISNGSPIFTVSIQPTTGIVNPVRTHNAIGIYSYKNIPSGVYDITVIDSMGCEVIITGVTSTPTSTTTTTTTSTTTLCYNPSGYMRTFYYNIQATPQDPVIDFSGSEGDACTAKFNFNNNDYSLVSPVINIYGATSHPYLYNGETINTQSCGMVNGYFIFSGNHAPTLGGDVTYISNGVIHVSNNVIVGLIVCE